MKKDNWIIKAFLMTFFIALIFNAAANVVINNCNYIALILVCLLFIVLGIMFDIIGTAVLTAKESTFHAKSSKKIKGAKTSIKMIKNSSKVSSFCADVIGDICGVLSGAISAMIAFKLTEYYGMDSSLQFLFSAAVSSLTVGGKAMTKEIAKNNSTKIIGFITKFINID
jgi:Mg2+/Co2+ transporter CorB